MRWPAILALTASVAALAVADWAARAADEDPPPAVAVGAYSGYSAAGGETWFCVGGVGGAGGARQQVSILNTSGSELRGMVRLFPAVPLGGRSQPWPAARVEVVVAPYAQLDIDPAATVMQLSPDLASFAELFVAAEVRLDGAGGVVAHDVAVAGAGDAAACLSAASPEWHFAAASTRRDAQARLALLNPFSDDAVADIGFATDDGRREPVAYQGVVVPAGTLLILDLGSEVTRRPQVAFSVVALVLLVSSVMILLMRIDTPALASEDGDEEERGMFHSIGGGISYLRSDGAMLVVFLLIVGMELLIRGPVRVGIPVLAHSRLAEGAFALGVVTSAYAGGSVLGTVLAGTLPAPGRWMGTIVIAVFTSAGVLMIPFGFLGTTWLAAGITLTIGIVGGYVGVLIISWIQGRTPQAMLGRIMSLLLVASVAVAPVSIVASGPLIKLSLEWVFIVSGGMLAAFSILVGLRREIRGMRMAGNKNGDPSP